MSTKTHTEEDENIDRMIDQAIERQRNEDKAEQEQKKPKKKDTESHKKQEPKKEAKKEEKETAKKKESQKETAKKETKEKVTEEPEKKEKQKGYDPWKVLKYPHLAEKSMNMVETENKLIFIVHKKASKGDIQDAIEDAFNVKVIGVKTQITRKGDKKAYIKLHPDSDAADVATRLGVI